ncbi:MAG: dCTP deaminase [Sedimentisphaerales bacterium]|nr:dCTP deaminase [Sedimentisphaerales bacterium]
MILSNTEIHAALDAGRLIIHPQPTPRTPTIGNPNCPFDAHTVDLRLDHEICIPTSGLFTIDLTQPGSFSEHLAKHSEKRILTSDQPYRLDPKKFILAQTMERVELPLQGEPPYLAARIEGKSSRARCGLLIHFTAPTVHPGFKGKLTLEMINLGPAAFLLSPGMYIAQLIIEQVTGQIAPNPSQFQDQSSPTGKIK